MEVVVVKLLAEKLSSVLFAKLKKQVWLVVKFKEEIESIYYELAQINLMLNDVGDTRNSQLKAHWLQNLRYVLTEGIDLLEESEEADNDFKEADNVFISFFNNWLMGQKFFFLRRMDKKIQVLKKRISDINDNGNKYVRYLKSLVDENAISAEDGRKKSSPHLDEKDQTVGIQEDIEVLADEILKENGSRVIAIVGMGGRGKTNLVKHVFNTQKVKDGFENRVWLYVSQKVDIEHLLQHIAHQIHLPGDEIPIHIPGFEYLLHHIGSQIRLPEDETTKYCSQVRHRSPSIELPKEYHHRLNEVSMDRLRDNIYTHLKAEKKPSIFVFDDLWHKDVLKRIGLRLLSHNSKNKIVVTTRDKGISNALGAEYTYHMKDLSEKESMELLCIHAFSKRKLPKDLESCGKDILNKCTRLPMAVEAMATQLNGVDKIPNHWKAALGRVNTEDVIKEKVMPILRPSYNEMPPLLKACFLSFASFPPNTPIHVEWLVYSWLATFIEIVSAGGDAVDVARSYIDQLVDLCVIQALHVSADGRVKSCQMQEFFHGLAFSESENVAKCLLKPKKDLPYLPVEDCKDARRISLVKNEIIKITETIQCPKLRILLLFENVNLQSISKTFFKELRYLVVLDLSQTGIKSLPESIQYLKRLRFLNLSQTKIEKLPESLSGLRRLQFLDVSRCEYLLRLHSGVGEHTSLLHLNVKGCKRLLSLPSGISKLSSLLTLQLKGVVFDKKPVANTFRWMDLQALEGFPNLRHLSTTFTAGSISKDFLGTSIWKSMTEMRVLSLQYDDSLCQRRVDIGEDRGVTVLDVCPIPTGLEFMERLEIIRLSKWRVLVPRPDWMFQLPNLTVLILDGDDSSSADDYKGLESIPNLRKLHLSGNKKCPKFPEEFGQRHAFPKLETLIIEDFNSLQKFPTLQPKAMPNLKRLQIINCRQMRDVPEGLERLKSLETLEFNSNRIKVRFREAMQKTERPPSGVSPTKNGCCQCIGKFSGNTRCCKCFG